MVGARVHQCTITKPFPLLAGPSFFYCLLGNLLTQAQRSHVADVGQSMISELVCSKAAEVMDYIHGLLEKMPSLLLTNGAEPGISSLSLCTWRRPRCSC